MKKTITIGRGNDCHIILSDERVSRRHCLLTIYPTGKMEIKDLSQNGTYVNGIKVPRNANFKVKRDDVVVFAQAEKLNWMAIEDPYKQARFSIACGVAALLLVIAFFVGKEYFFSTPSINTYEDNSVSTPVNQGDSKKETKEDNKNKKEADAIPIFPEQKEPVTSDNGKKNIPTKKGKDNTEPNVKEKKSEDQQHPQDDVSDVPSGLL